MRQIYLASASPRRQDILKTAGFSFSTIIANVSEEIHENRADKMVEILADRKASFVAEMMAQYGNYLIIGADTVVYLDGTQLGKPSSRKEAHEGLEMLAGNTHQVITGVSLYYDSSDESGVPLHKNVKFHATTEVDVAPMTTREIEDYLDTGEYIDKAGGYGIQGAFSKFITGIRGEYNNVVGFPIAKFYSECQRLGLFR